MITEVKTNNNTGLIPRQHQIYVEEALNLTVVDLLNMPNGEYFGFLSKADLILIFTVFGDLNSFLKAYKEDVQKIVDTYNYSVVANPHYFLKKVIG